MIQQQGLFLGNMFAAPGFLLTSGKDFIIRDVRDFKVPGKEMLSLLTTGRSIRTGYINIVQHETDIYIDTTNSGMVSYIISEHAVREFVTISYPGLATVCKHESQEWCYMKNGGETCIYVHKKQDLKTLKDVSPTPFHQ
jgi:hypothetical protein